MDSDEELLDASDAELMDDEDYYYYSEGGGEEGSAGGGGSDEDGCGVGDQDFESSEVAMAMSEKRYVVLTEDDVCQRQEEDIIKVSAILSIPRDAASVLLRHYKWNISKLHDEWFADEERVRDVVGLPENRVDIPNRRKLTCGICFEVCSPSVISSAGCAHYYCHECWKGYISASISDGPGCLALRCPDPSCSATVVQEMINKLASNDNKERYARFVFRSYVEDNKKTKWCPGPDCKNAVEFLSDGNYDVLCKCRYSFCWQCTEEAHRPVSCETVSKWILKNSAESENMNWILANSKPCPKCKRPIEKNQGCMHMTCSSPCKFEFCWLCLGAWSDHGERTGGFYACNRYESAKKEGVYDEAETRRERAKNSLERYMHYYERWASNQTSRKKAQSDLETMEGESLGKLSQAFGIPETQLNFITEAWSQIVECRRVLKWTYAYGYYLDDKVKSEFFEYLQGEAEVGLERLHQCAEKELQVFMPSKSEKSDQTAPSPSVQDFDAFRVKLAGLTRVTHNYFENLVQALEAGLEDVHSAGQTTASSNTSSSMKPGTKGKSGKKKVARTSSSGSSDDEWVCERCTLANSSSRDACDACDWERC